MRVGWFRRHRTAIASGTVVAVAGASLLVYALSDPGYAVHHANLNDGGVWVSNSIDYGAFARVNKPLGQMDIAIGMGPKEDPQQKQNTLDVVQDGNAVFGRNDSTHELKAFDTATGGTVPDATATIPAGAAIQAGGSDPGVLAVLDAVTGDLRATHIDPDEVARDLSAVDAEATKKPLYQAKSAASLAVSTSGTIFVAGKSGRLTTISPNANGFDQPSVKSFGDATTDVPQVTAVGESPVILTGSKVVLPNGRTADLGKVSKPVLQQPGPSAGTVVVAAATGLAKVDLGNGAITWTTLKNPGVTPAAPVVAEGCVFGAWYDSGPSRLTDCPGQPGSPWETGLPDGSPEDPLVFRVNRGRVLLNDTAYGKVWDVDGPQPKKVDNWLAVLPNLAGKENDKDDNSLGNHVQPIKAVDDAMYARPGVTSVLHVLDNDTYPKGHVIAISNQPTTPSDPRAKVTLSQDEQTIAITLPADERVAVSFNYTITDSGDSKPSTAKVSVSPVADSVNDAPTCPQCAQREWKVGAGTVLDMPVLPDWRDQQNDPLALVSAKLDDAATPGQAAPIVTSTGDILFTAPATPPAGGTVSLSYQVSDGRGGIATGQARVQVLSAKDPNAGARPVTFPDVAQATVGQPLTVFPLANDLPGSDPTTDDPTLQLSDVSQRAGAAVEKDTVHGSFTFTASRPGVFMLTYSATYGAQSAVGTVRIDAQQPGRTATQPVALPDTAVVFGSMPTTVDVLANDYDQGGGLLVVQNATAASGSDLQVAVIGGHWLQIAVPNRPPKSVPEYVSYTITNGTDEATGTVAVLEHDARDTEPVALPDTADVRAGDSVTIPVVDNDIDPAGAPLTLVPGSVDNLTGGGSAYTVGSTIRYIAPAATTATSAHFDYTVTDGVKSATGSVELRIHPVNPATNQGPHPQVITARVVAGGTIKIPIPTSGVDPDGDSVTLVGQRDPGPKLGTITATTSSSITYAAFPIDYLGTDTIGYRVTDRFGRVGDSTIRIAVVMPGELQPPVPVDDRYEAQPGAQLSLDVVSNDIVAAGDTVKVTLPEAGSQATIDASNPRVLHVTAPPAAGEPLQVRYGLVGGTGQSERLGQLTVLGRNGFDNPPVARDDNAKPVSRTAGTVTVPVLANDADPEGDKIVVSKVWGGTLDAAKQKVTITLTAAPQVIPYEISDGKKTASALIFVPALGHGSAYVKTTKYIQVPKDGSTATIDINDYVASPDGKLLRLGFPDNFTVAPSAGLTLVKKDGTHFVLTGTGGYVGPASITVQVTNGSSVADQGASNDFVTIPVQVGDPTPVLRCPVNHTTLLYQGGAPTTVDLAAVCHLWVPVSMSVDKVRITTAWKPGASIAGVNGNFGSGDGQLTLDPTRDAHAGQSGVIVVGIAGSTQTQTVAVRVLKVPPLTLDAINRTGHNNKQLKIDIKAVTHTVIRNPNVQVSNCAQSAGQAAQCTAQGQYLLITPADTSSGAMTFSFEVTDVPGDATRAVKGTATVNTIGRPASVGSVTANANRSTGGEVQVSWTPPAFDGGAPIDHFLVKSSSGGPTKECTGSTCVVTGLTNGQDYTFAVTAWNTAGQESLKPVVSNVARPDKRPAVPANVSVVPGDNALTLSWTYTENGSSALKQIVIQQQDITGAETRTINAAAAARSMRLAVVNGHEYRYRVAAVNDLGIGGFSTPAVPAQTAGRPAAMPAPNVPPEADVATSSVFAHITWDPEPTPNGGPIDYYSVSRRVAGTAAWTVLPQCSKVDPSARQCDDKLSNNGTKYEYMITATNSTVPAGHGVTSSPGAVTPFEASGRPATVKDLKAYASAQAFDTRTPDYGPTGGTGASVNPNTGQAIKISFTVPAANAAGIARMEYSVNGVNHGTLPGGPWVPGSEGTATIDGLQTGKPQSVSIWAVNSSNKTGAPSTGTQDSYPYGLVADPSPVATSAGSKVTYKASSSASGGRPIDHLLVSVDGETEYTISGGTMTAIERDKGYNKPYSLTVKAVDTAGQTSRPVTVTGTTENVPAPTGLSCGPTSTYSRILKCSWSNPDPAYVTGYRYRWDGGIWIAGGSPAQSGDFGDYQTSHSFDVESTDDGTHWSSPASTTAATGAVPAPENLNCTPANELKFTCSWNRPATGLTYRWRWGGSGNGWTDPVNQVSTTYTYGTDQYSKSYTFEVQATDGNNHWSSAPSFPINTGKNPNPESVTLTVGAARADDSNCTGDCHFFHVSWSGLGAGDHPIACGNATAGEFDRPTISGGSGSADLRCYQALGYHTPTWVKVYSGGKVIASDQNPWT